MPWFLVDDEFWAHPRMADVPMSARGLWVTCGSYSCKFLTKGLINYPTIRKLGGSKKDINLLIEKGLWEQVSDAEIRFRDWDDYQLDHEKEKRKRDLNRGRQRRYREKKRRPCNALQDGNFISTIPIPITNIINSPTESREAPLSAENFTYQIRSVFEYWVKVMGKRADTKLTADRKQKIRARLREGYSAEDICRAIDGCRSSSFHMGSNENGKVYDDLTLICRTGSKLEEFRDVDSVNSKSPDFLAEKRKKIHENMMSAWESGDRGLEDKYLKELKKIDEMIEKGGINGMRRENRSNVR